MPLTGMTEKFKKLWSIGQQPGGGGTLGISGWGCAARTLKPLAYARASFIWILLPYTRVNSPNHSYPTVAVFQKLRSLAQSKAKLIISSSIL